MIHENKISLTDQNILLISPESWGSNRVSKHHFAVQLSKFGNYIYFLDPPSSFNSIKQITGNLKVIKYKPRFKGLRKFPSIISGYLISKEIKILEKWLNVKFDIIWNFDSSRFFNLRQIKSKLKIAHIVDWNENFNRIQLCKTSSITLCTSGFLYSELKRHNTLTFNIGHGYNLSEYKLCNKEEKLLRSNYSINVGYVGNLSIKYIDWEIIYKLIIENREMGFYFIGPSGKSNLSQSIVKDQHYEKIKKLNNAIFLGEFSGEKIPTILSHFDILLLIYKGQKYIEQLANPHKILEYLGSGNVIISSWTEEYKNRIELIEMLNCNDEIPKKFKEVSNNLKYYNSKSKSAYRKNFAIENSYANKIHAIEKLISINILK